MSRYSDFIAEVREAITGNIAYKALALAFALMMWIWVQSEQVVEDRARVRLEWRLPEGLMLVEPPLETATVTVEGVQAFVRAVRQKDLSINIDLSRAKEGEVTLDLSEKAVSGMPGQVRVVSVSPNTLKVQLDRVLKRRVTVTAATRGEPAEGYRVASVRVEPDRLELVGPSTVLRGLTEVPTDVVDLSGLREDAEFDVGLGVRKGQLVPAHTGPIVVAVKVEPVVKERAFTQVPVEIRDGDDYIAGAPTVSLTVKGPAEQVDALNQRDISVVVNVPDGYSGGGGEARRGPGGGLRYEVQLPEEGLSVSAVEPESIPVVHR